MKHQAGFSLFELIVVVVIIGILVSVSLEYYGKLIEDSRRIGIEAQARNFTAAVSGAHAQWLINNPRSKLNSVDLEGIKVYVNKRGWPTHTKKNKRRSNKNQRCYELWLALLQNPTPASVAGSDQWGRYEYHISAINGDSCRYELTVKPRGTYFFDYVLDTGQIFVTVPARE